MANYVVLIDFTDQGEKNIGHTCERATTFVQDAAKFGIEVKHQFWTLGGHDGVLIFEAPDDTTATAAMLNLGAMGNVKTQTLRAFSADEMSTILGKAFG